MGGLEQASTSFVGEEPLVPQLAGILGTVEGMQKWRDLLRSASISRTFLGLKLGQISSHFTLQFCGIMFKHYKHNCQVQAFLRRLWLLQRPGERQQVVATNFGEERRGGQAEKYASHLSVLMLLYMLQKRKLVTSQYTWFVGEICQIIQILMYLQVSTECGRNKTKIQGLASSRSLMAFPGALVS